MLSAASLSDLAQAWGRVRGTMRASEGGGPFIEGTISLEKGSSLGELP